MTNYINQLYVELINFCKNYEKSIELLTKINDFYFGDKIDNENFEYDIQYEIREFLKTIK